MDGHKLGKRGVRYQPSKELIEKKKKKDTILFSCKCQIGIENKANALPVETKKPNHKITLPKLKSNLILDELILPISNILSNIIYYQHVLTNKGVR